MIDQIRSLYVAKFAQSLKMRKTMSNQSAVLDGDAVNAVADLARPIVHRENVHNKVVLTTRDNKSQVFDDPKEAEPSPIRATTLQAVVDFVGAQIAQKDVAVSVVSAQTAAGEGPFTEPVVVHIESPTSVKVLSPFVGSMRQRFTYLEASPLLPKLILGEHMAMEPFMIQLMTCFMQSDERTDLQKLCSNLGYGIKSEVEDDGLSQSVAVKTATTRVASVTAKNPWQLAPYRSFSEIDQPETSYILRLKGDENVLPTAALFEADGGIWRVTAIKRIGEWLTDRLPEGTILLS